MNMKKIKILSILCILCIVFSLFSPICAVNRDPETTDVTENEQKTADKSEAENNPASSDPAKNDFFAGSDQLSAPEITARNALLLDLDTGVVYFSRDPDGRAYPASLTKIMTVLLAVEAVERGDLDLKAEITAGDDCLRGLDQESSTAGIVPGEKMTLENYLYCAMISSANEACNVIATTVSGSIDAFVQRMNERAAELGCTGTHFVNPHGMPDENHFTTASDLAIITREAMQHELFVTVCNTLSRTVPATNKADTRVLQNTNGLINPNSAMYPGYFYEPAAGVKTGHTADAGYCLVSTALQNDIHMLCIVLGSGEGVRANGTAEYQNFTDTLTLYHWVYDNFSRQTILGETELVASAHVELGSGTDSVALRPQSDVIAVLPNGADPDDYQRKVTVYSERDNTNVTAPVAAGDVLGEITIEKDGTVYGSVPLVAAVDVELSRGAYMRSGIQAFFARPVVIVILALILAIFALYVVTVVRYQKRQKARKRAAARARREASLNREHQARDEILRELTQDSEPRRR